MGKPYYISIPCGLTRTEQIIDIAKRMKSLDSNIHIHAYDAVQGLLWNGGRIIYNSRMSQYSIAKNEQLYDVTVENLPEAVRRVRMLNDHGIPFNLTLNNVLENVDIEDEDGNYLLRNLENDLNSVTLATRALTYHVKSNYPKFKTMCSICFAYGKIEEYLRACEIYDLVVMIPIFAYLPEKVAQLPVEKLSFIVNDNCNLFCQRKEHYQSMSRASMAGLTTIDEQARCKTVSCPYRQKPGYRKLIPDGFDEKTCDRVAAIASKQFDSLGDLSKLPGGVNFNISPIARAELVKIGVNHFKLQGREMNQKNFDRQVVEFLEAFVKNDLL
ncbi:MAG TPA: hypothetical protein PKL14_08505 [Holophaga sp.]|jgi:hypothetical protein|nr:hypothetical protein [Holophaga sp.]